MASRPSIEDLPVLGEVKGLEYLFKHLRWLDDFAGLEVFWVMLYFLLFCPEIPFGYFRAFFINVKLSGICFL